MSNYQSNFGAVINNNANEIETKQDESSYTMTNPLIAMIGISEYDRDVFPNLDCVVDDYKNVQHAFHCVREYSFVYFNKRNQIRHKKGKLHKNIISSKEIKLRWNENEILNFNDQLHKILQNKTYNYDGLIYFIACHGDKGSVIYDSSGNKVPLIIIFDKFNNQNCIQLRNKPKIYFIEACRGDQRTKRFENSLFDSTVDLDGIDNGNIANDSTQNENATDNSVTTLKVDSNDTSSTMQANESKDQNNISNLKVPSIASTKAIDHALQSYNPILSVQKLTTIDENDDENKNQSDTDKMKSNINSINSLDTKSDLNLTFSKYNYNREIYANTEGYTVAEPIRYGAYMTRSITQVIENDDIFKTDFDNIIHHTRKIMLKLMGTSVACGAQVIQDNNNIPKKLFFG